MYLKKHFSIQVIERGSLERLKESIEQMKNCAGACPGPERYLDVCCIQSVVSKVKGGSTLYYMTLLAHATVFSRYDMAKMLIENGASEWHLLYINIIDKACGFIYTFELLHTKFLHCELHV